jgi:hypothetical protein
MVTQLQSQPEVDYPEQRAAILADRLRAAGIDPDQPL